MCRMLATLAFILAVCLSTAAAQAQTELFQETLHIGRGAVQYAQWHPSGNLILVDTVTGAWLYDNNLTDIAHLPDARLARFNLDGRIIAGIDAANNLTFWDSTTFTQIDSYPGNTAYVIALEWSPNQTQIATLDRTGRILVWDLERTVIQFEARLNSADQIAWSKNGSYLAAMNTDNGAVSVWDKSGRFVLSLKQSNYGYLYAAAITWRDDVQLLRWFGEENAVTEVWDVATQILVAQPRGGAASDMKYSPDGTTLAVAGYGSGVQNAENPTVFVMPIQSITATVTAWSPDNKYVAFGEWSNDVTIDSHVFIMEAATGEIIHQLNQSFHFVKGVYWNPDSQGLLVVDGANRLSLFPLSDAVTYRGSSAVHMDIGATADWSSDGSRIAVADTFWGLRVWDIETGEAIASLMNIGQPASKVVWQPDGTFIAAKSGDRWWQVTDRNVYLWDLANPQIDNYPMIIPNVDSVADIEWSPDGETLAVAERGRFIRFWSPARPEVTIAIDLWEIRLTPFIDYSQMMNVIQWSSDNRILNYSYLSFGGGLLDIQERKLLEDYSPHTGSDWVWTSDNRLIWVNWQPYVHPHSVPPPFSQITIGLGYDTNIPEGAEWPKPMILAGLPQSSSNAVLSPQAHKVIGFDKADNAIIWDLEPQSLRVRLYGVNDAVWSPNETMLVTYGVDGVLRVIDSASGENLHSFDNHFNPPNESSPDRLKVFWSPDSHKIALLDRGALYIYEVAV